MITDRSKIRSVPARSETLERIPSSGQAGCDSSSAHRELHDSGYVRDKSSAAGYLAHCIGGQLMLRYVGSRVVGWRTHWYVANPRWAERGPIEGILDLGESGTGSEPNRRHGIQHHLHPSP